MSSPPQWDDFPIGRIHKLSTILVQDTLESVVGQPADRHEGLVHVTNLESNPLGQLTPFCHQQAPFLADVDNGLTICYLVLRTDDPGALQAHIR